MKALKMISVLAAAIICLCSCSNTSDNKEKGTSGEPATTAPFGGIVPKDEKFAGKNGFDVDLTAMSSSMVYAQVSDMITNPDSYKGKSVRAKGPFSYLKDNQTGNEYFAVIISDATACCSQGIEFVLEGNKQYPKDYPAVDTEITVTGTFNYYYEGQNIYCQLLDAKLEEGGLSW